MNCIKCELTRAHFIAAGLAIVGKSNEEIAAALCVRFGEYYYVESGIIYRASKLPPYKPHLIRSAKDGS